MRNVGVQIVSLDGEADRRPGAVAVRLRGVTALPDMLALHLTPIDTIVGKDTLEPSRPIHPTAVNQNGTSADLVICADGQHAAPFEPGTPVKLTIPALGLERTLRWPRHTDPTGLNTGGAAAGPATRASQQPGHDTTAQRRTPESTAIPPQLHTAPTETGNTTDTDASQRSSTRVRSEPLQGPSGKALRAAAASARATAPAPPDPPTASTIEAIPSSQFPHSDAARLQVTARNDAIRRHGRSWGGWIGNVSVGACIATLAIGALVFGARTDQAWVPPQVRTLLIGATDPAPVSAKRLAAVLDIPDVSPAGIAAAEVTAAEAMRRARSAADPSASTGHREEAKFWLRRALSARLTDAGFSNISSELGALYADPPTGKPDYNTARLLWELAATRENPQALCHLAGLYQHGHGVARDISRAVGYYAQAAKIAGDDGRLCAGIAKQVADGRRMSSRSDATASAVRPN